MGEFYITKSMKTSAVFGCIYCVGVLLACIVYYWSTFLSKFKNMWPRFNSEASASARNSWIAAIMILVFAMYRCFFIALIVIEYGDGLTLPQTIIGFVLSLLFLCFYL